MCCLFGLIDSRLLLNGEQKTQLLHSLATAAEVRGTDASGVAYHDRDQLVIRKAPVPGHKLKFYIPDNATAIMGHTRLTTQGNPRKNKNNHPFLGRIGFDSFALAHNGVIYNDRELQQKLCLPKTKIETDSYVAVQLLERQGSLGFTALKQVAEKMEGSFTFTVLDQKRSLYIVKGDSPFCLYQFPASGLYVYASTEEVVKSAGVSVQDAARIHLTSGEILRIDRNGKTERRVFDDNALYQFRSPLTHFSHCCGSRKNKTYVDELKSVSYAFGYTSEMIDILLGRGYMPEEIEEFLYDQGM